MRSAGSHHFLHLLCRFRKNDTVRRLYLNICGGVGMLFAYGPPCLEAISKALLECTQNGCDAFLVARHRQDVVESHKFLRE
jgi:hypothetical protein